MNANIPPHDHYPRHSSQIPLNSQQSEWSSCYCEELLSDGSFIFDFSFAITNTFSSVY